MVHTLNIDLLSGIFSMPRIRDENHVHNLKSFWRSSRITLF